jgi:exonuclease SbcC
LATTLEDALKAAHIEKSNKEEALIKAQQTQSKIQNWQERHFHLKIWSEDWVKYNAQFESSIKLFEELRAARQSQAGEEVNAQKWADKIEESQKREALAEKKVEDLARRLEQESNQMQTLGDFMSLSQCNLNLERKKMSLCQSLDLAKSAGQSESDIRLIEKDIAHSEEEIGRMDGELLSARESEQHAEFLWSQAREDEQIAERNASANVSGLRTQLKSGQACPVCGSTEHPLALQSETASLELSLSSARQKSLEQKKQTESARQRVNELQNALTRLHTHLEHSKTKLLEADKNLNKIRLDLENLNVAWPIAATFQDETQKTIAGLEIEILETHQKITAGQQLNASIEKLRKETIDAERALTAQRAATVESQAQRQIVLERLKDLATAIEQKDRELTTTLDLLSYPHQNKPDWRSHWQQNPTGYAKEISEAVARWNDGQIAAQRTANDIAQLQTQLAAASQAFTEKEQQFKKNAADLNEIESKIKQISQQMDGLLNGVSLNEFSSALRQAVQSAENEYGQALEHFNDHEKDLHRLQGLMQQNHEALNNAKNLWLTQFETCQNIGSKCGFYLSEENASEILKNLLVEIERLRAREVQIHTDLNVNLNNLRMREDLTQRIEEKERVALNWAKLSELIGSADGDKFRKEAHRLTLKVLFAHANYHLQSFARRYRLFIPPEGAQGILVQDLDIGGELRSVYSLSGGESFLVSLALAMGLASLSSHQIPVESLFIDEGFGSLDSETLKVAMDALDRLQAQGRKVGVISHVPDMADRIGVQIRVKPDGEGRSRIFIPGKGV